MNKYSTKDFALSLKDLGKNNTKDLVLSLKGLDKEGLLTTRRLLVAVFIDAMINLKVVHDVEYPMVSYFVAKTGKSS